ncbi:MAG: hypothetical protein HKN26_09880 [Acidimicrobiales bacterium]|nr:hypothetical protein [Acidimicrobiales bacterium]
MAGGLGHDAIFGAAGDDYLDGQGGRGNDALNGGAGFDICDGGPGIDGGAACERRIGIP